jgi:hypothetical protein
MKHCIIFPKLLKLSSATVDLAKDFFNYSFPRISNIFLYFRRNTMLSLTDPVFKDEMILIIEHLRLFSKVIFICFKKISTIVNRSLVFSS